MTMPVTVQDYGNYDSTPPVIMVTYQTELVLLYLHDWYISTEAFDLSLLH